MSTTDIETAQSPATERGSSLLDPAVFGGPMRLSDLVEGYWAITEAMHTEILGIYGAHMRGDKIDIKGVEARLGRPLANERAGYSVQEGVAIIPMSGVISPKANLMMQVSGGTSAQILRSDIMAAAEDPKVKAGILYADTPGGNVLGIAEAAAAWRDFAASKPAVTFSDGTIASAGYWVGSAGSKVYISGPMVNVGSIGVRTEHVDSSMADAARGVKRTLITAGRYKAAGDGPLDPKTLEYKQAQVDYLYTLFTDTVAQHRGVSVDKVLADMADGRVFIGQQAIDAGLVDGFASLEQLVAQLADNPAAVAPLRQAAKRNSKGRSAQIQVPESFAAVAGDAADAIGAVASLPDEPVPPVASVTTTQPQKGTPMSDTTRASLERDHPAIVAEISSEARAAGATAERERIQAVLAQSMPGHEALVQTLAFDGKTTGPEAAVAVLGAHREVLAKAKSGHFADAPPAVPPSGSAAGHQAEGDKDKGEKRQVNVSRAYAAMNSGSKATA